jgi:hypothetical protein
MLGKVLYNKSKYFHLRCGAMLLESLISSIDVMAGKGDPGGPSATAKEREREQEIDSKIRDPTPLPPHLEKQSRRSSRVDVNVSWIPDVETGSRFMV